MGVNGSCLPYSLEVHGAGCSEDFIADGGVCTAVCPSGMKPNVDHLDCREGVFSPMSFTCESIGCRLPAIENTEDTHKCSEFFGHTIPSGTECTTVCDEGYISYPPVLSCASGVLSYKEEVYTNFRCVAISDHCTLPDTLGDGVATGGCVAGASLDVGESCSVSCRDGYTQHGETSEYKCDAKGLHAPDMICSVNDCTVPNTFSENVMSGKDNGCVPGVLMPAGGSCSVRCPEGYDPAGTTAFVCNDGLLQNASLTCTAKNCGALPVASLAAHAQFETTCDSTSFPSSCVAHCETGYSGVHQPWSCSAAGTWSGVSPTCKVNECHALPELNNAQFAKFCVHLFGESCLAECAPGYEGASQMYNCTAEEAWAGTPPQCTPIRCKENFRVVDHVCTPCEEGKINAAGDEAELEDTLCDNCAANSYRSAAESTCRTCPTNSSTLGVKGSVSVSACKCDPGTTGHIEHDTDSCSPCLENTYKGTSGSASCSACPAHSTTRSATGRTSISDCMCNSGYFGIMSGESPGCSVCPIGTFKDFAGDSPACTTCPLHSSTASTASTKPGDCLCDAGYTGDLSQPEPTCTACPANFYKDKAGSSNCTRCPLHSSASAAADTIFGCSCDEGYTQVTNTAGTSFTCKPNECDVTSLDKFANAETSSCNGVTTGDSCQVACGEGFTGESSSFTCNANGKFSGDVECNANTCAPLTDQTGLDLSQCLSVKTFKNCTASCALGYSGQPQEFQCATSGLLMGTVPTCHPNACAAPATTEGVVIKQCENIRTAESCELTCDEGYYVANGPATTNLTCNADGTLSGAFPACEISHCQPLDPLTGVDFSAMSEEHAIGFSNVVRCLPGYTNTQAPTLHNIIPFGLPDASIQEGTGKEARIVTPHNMRHYVIPALSGTPGAVSIKSDNNKIMSHEKGLVTFEVPSTSNLFAEASSFYLLPALNGKAGFYSLSPINVVPSVYVRSSSNVALKLEAKSASVPDFDNKASFAFDPALSSLPSTMESTYKCSSGGVYSGIPPFCEPNLCAAPKAQSGIDFSRCADTRTGGSCEVVCSAGYALDTDSETGTLTCEANGEFSGSTPTCVPQVCTMQAVGVSLNTNACTGKRTDERCFVGCKEGYSATSLLVDGKQPIPSHDLNAAPWAAGTSLGCMDCGQGEYAAYPCDHEDPVTSCRNWCSATTGCNYFYVHTSGDDIGRCCRVTDIPDFNGGANPNVQFYAMSGDLVVVSARDMQSKADLDAVCAKYNGMSVVSIQTQAKLEKVAAMLSGSSYSASKVPIGFDASGTHQFKDLEDGRRSINSLLSSANDEATSTFFEQTIWQNSNNKLVGIQNSALTTFGFSDIHAVVCERAMECGPEGFHGELPTCVPQQCHLPAHTGTDFSDCVGKTTGETCTASCKTNHHRPDVVYNYDATITVPVQRHSKLARLPKADLNLAFIAKVTTSDHEWSRGALALLGGVESCCSSGGLYVFTTTSHDAGCLVGSNKFAFGVSHACGSDPVVVTGCKYSKHVDYTVAVTAAEGRVSISVDGATPVSALSTIAVSSIASGEYAISYLTSCHSETKDFVASSVQYPKVFGDIKSSVLTCGADRQFSGDLPCLQGECPVPNTPLSVDYSGCEGTKAGHYCSVSCREGNPSVDVAYDSAQQYSSPNTRLGHMADLPYGSPLTIEFSGKVSTTKSTWESMDWLLLGGSETYCCGGSMYVFTASGPQAGCTEGANKYAIGFGIQCKNSGAEAPLMTSCEFDKDTTYSIKATYGHGTASIYANNDLKISAQKDFQLVRSGSSGYALSVLNGCHDQTHETLEGSISNIRVYSTVASHELTCNGADMLFTGELPSCLDNTCPVPASSGVDFNDCISKKSGENCVAKCKPGYSEDGVGSSDVRDDAVLWLEASDMHVNEVGRNAWADHRGSSFSSHLDIQLVNMHFDKTFQGARFRDDNSFVLIDGLNIGPSVAPHLTMEAWVKLDHYANNKGWFLGHDDSGYDRTLILHDSDFSEEQTISKPAIGVGHTYNSRLPQLPTGEWVHVVGTWSQGGDSYMYVNGVQEHVSSETMNGEGHDYVMLGRHPTPGANQFFNGFLSSMRIYHRSLTKDEVISLYNKGRAASSPTLAPATETGRDVRGTALVWLDAGDVTETAWRDHRGTGFSTAHPVSIHNVQLNHAEGGVQMNDSSFVTIDLDVSPNVRPQVSMEMWVKLVDAGNETGWAMGQDNGGYDRTLILHDQAFGSGCALGVGHPYESDCPAPSVGEWAHYVGVWSQYGEATIYRNGVKYSSVHNVNNGRGNERLFVGRHPTQLGSGINGYVATVRVYGHALTASEVESLYRLEETTYESVDVTALKAGASVSLRGKTFTEVQWPDARVGLSPVFTYESVGAELASDGVKFQSLTIQSEFLSGASQSFDLWIKLSQPQSDTDTLLSFDQRSISLPKSLRTRTWHHVCVTFAADGNVIVYVDGVPTQFRIFNKAGLPNSVVFGEFANHNVGHLRVFPSVLASPEVLALFNAERGERFQSVIEPASGKVTTCNAQTFDLACHAGNSIHIKSARYGRFDDTTCLENQVSTERCEISTTLHRVVSACEGRSSCDMNVVAASFGADSCEHVVKYLEVDYSCASTATTPNLVQSDVRAKSDMWLEASDLSLANSKPMWRDHRGAGFSFGSVDLHAAAFDEDETAIRFTSKNTNLQISGVNVNPSAAPSLSVEMWVKVKSATNNRGFAFGAQSTDSELTRSIFLHDDRFDGSHVSIGVEQTYDAETSAVSESDRWTHVVAVFNQAGESAVYKNGLKEVVPFTTINVDAALQHFFIGGHPSFDSFYFNGWLSSVRIYSFALADMEVRDLYRAGRLPLAWGVPRSDESARMFTCSADGSFNGLHPTCKANTCLEPEPILGVDFGSCESKVTGESCSVSCAPGYTGGVTTFAAQHKKTCASHSTKQALVGSKTLQECKAACLAGLNPDTPQAAACNAISYDHTFQACTLFQGCSFGQTTETGAIEFFSVTSALSSSLTCGVFGRFSGSTPTCVAADKAHSSGGMEHVCEGGVLNLSCPDHKLIKVKEANFGRTSESVCPSMRSSNTSCFSVTAMDVVSQRCEGHGSCSIVSSVDTFGNPCAETDKYLEVDYECVDPVFFDSGHQTVCDKKQAVLECSGNKVLEISSAFYGRKAFEPCPECGSARNNLTCDAGNILGSLRNRCSGHASCSFNVEPTSFDVADPCVDTSKYLDVNYECHELPVTHRACQEEHLDVDCGADKMIHVKSAFWGRSSFLACPADNRIRTNCSSPIAIDSVVAACEGESSCSVPATSAFMGGDPCPETHKYLELDYECRPRPPTVRVCDGRDAVLGCSAGNTLHIEKAQYGRTESQDCRAEGMDFSNTNCVATDSLMFVEQSCTGREGCVFSVNNITFGDHALCPSTSKYLDVWYSCKAPAL